MPGLARTSICISSSLPYHKRRGRGLCLYFCIGLSTGKELDTDWLERNNKHPLFETHLLFSGTLVIQFLWAYLTQVGGSAYGVMLCLKEEEEKQKNEETRGERSGHTGRKSETLKSDPSWLSCAPKCPQWVVFLCVTCLIYGRHETQPRLCYSANKYCLPLQSCYSGGLPIGSVYTLLGHSDDLEILPVFEMSEFIQVIHMHDFQPQETMPSKKLHTGQLMFTRQGVCSGSLGGSYVGSPP